MKNRISAVSSMPNTWCAHIFTDILFRNYTIFVDCFYFTLCLSKLKCTYGENDLSPPFKRLKLLNFCLSNTYWSHCIYGIYTAIDTHECINTNILMQLQSLQFTPSSHKCVLFLCLLKNLTCRHFGLWSMTYCTYRHPIAYTVSHSCGYATILWKKDNETSQKYTLVKVSC